MVARTSNWTAPKAPGTDPSRLTAGDTAPGSGGAPARWPGGRHRELLPRPMAEAVARMPVALGLTVLLSGSVLLFDLLDDAGMPDSALLRAAPYAVLILIAAYLLPPRSVAVVGLCALVAESVVASNHRVPLESAVVELLDLLIIGCLGTALSSKTRRETVLKRRAEADFARLQAVVESMVEGVIITDSQGNAVSTNSAARWMMPRSEIPPAHGPSHPTEATGGLDLLHPDGRPMAPEEAPLSRILRGETITDLEARVRSLGQGSPRIARFSGRPVLGDAGRIAMAVLTVRDVTEEHRAAEALRQSEERFRLVVTNSADMVFFQDSDLRFTWVANPMPPFTEEQILGATVYDLFAQEEAERLTVTKRRVLATGVGAMFHTTMALDGRERHFQTGVEPRRDAGGRIIGLAGYVRDITEQRRAQAELLEQQSTLAVLGERERIARELHDSIGQVLGYINTEAQAVRKLLSKGRLEMADSYLAGLVAAAQEAHTDVREFIMGVKASASVGDGLLPTLEQHLHSFGRSQEIRTELVIPEGMRERGFSPSVEVQLLRILLEALTNVRKHASARLVRVIFNVAGERARIVVEDDGRGFDPEAPRPGGGQSLGLGIMRERAEQVGGRVEIRSIPGRGTQVIVYVPMCKEAPDEADQVAAGR